MTIAPWRIPMEHLRWGHYSGDGDSLVWIQLQGATDRNWLWYNGDYCSSVEITDDCIKLFDRELELQLIQKRPLESEKKMLNTIRSLKRWMPWFASLVPRKFLLADEVKWVSRGILGDANINKSTGACIHESVDFNPAL